MKRFPRHLARAVACLALAGGLVIAVVSAGTSSAATAVTTPTSGPLSKAPKVKAPKAAPSGKLVKIDLVKGTGAVVAPGDIVTINQVIANYSGKVLASTWTSGKPLIEGLAAAQVIPGLIKGLPGARVCGRRELIVPAKLADALPSKLPARKTTLIYIVDVLSAMAPTGGANHLCGPDSQPSS